MASKLRDERNERIEVMVSSLLSPKTLVIGIHHDAMPVLSTMIVVF